jgi:plastocyanin
MSPAKLIVVAIVAVLGAVGAACGEIEADDPTPVQTWKITPAAGSRTAVPPTQPAETPTQAPDQTPGAGTTLTLAGINSTFDKEELEAPAGTITIVFDNRDGGVIHNIHFFRGDSARGESVGETDLEPGPVEQTLTMTLEPGDYFYQCDVHPTTMKGSLSVGP